MNWPEWDGLDDGPNLLRLCGEGYNRQEEDEGRAYVDGLFLKHVVGGWSDDD